MDKKNTMLLTVIAVSTLLVAVVGATFAYFSVSNSTATNTTVNASVEQVGTVTLTGGGTINKTITAAQMAQSAAPYTYDLGSVVVANANLAGNGTKEKYYCRFSLTVANTSTMDSQTADGGLDINVATGVTVSTGFTKGTALSPKTVKAGTYTVDFTMGNGGTFAGGDLITAGGVIKNTTDGTQADRLAGKNINVSYTISNFRCDTAPLS